MITSSMLGSPLLITPKPSYNTNNTSQNKPINKVGIRQNRNVSYGCDGSGWLIECSSRPQKKATAHHMKTRPKKRQPWDKNRKPTVYDPLPPLPPDWTLVSSSSSSSSSSPSLEVGGSDVGSDVGTGDGRVDAEASLPSSPSLQAPLTSG